jgi:hypothetical protein
VVQKHAHQQHGTLIRLEHGAVLAQALYCARVHWQSALYQSIEWPLAQIIGVIHVSFLVEEVKDSFIISYGQRKGRVLVKTNAIDIGAKLC